MNLVCLDPQKIVKLVNQCAFVYEQVEPEIRGRKMYESPETLTLLKITFVMQPGGMIRGEATYCSVNYRVNKQNGQNHLGEPASVYRTFHSHSTVIYCADSSNNIINKVDIKTNIISFCDF